MMRKVLCFLICALLLLSSCGKTDTPKTSDDTNKTGKTENEVTENLTVDSSSNDMPEDSSILPEEYNPDFRWDYTDWATDGEYVFFIQQSDDYHYDLYRIGSENDAIPVKLVSVETPTQLGQHDGYAPITHVIATPDKIYYYALVSVTDDGSCRHAFYEMTQMNKDGNDARPIDMGPTEFQFIGIDGFKLYYDGNGDDDICCLDLISSQVTRLSGYETEVEKDYFGSRFGVYNGAFYYYDAESQGERYNTRYYSVDINSRERKEICSIEGRYPAEPLRFAEGYLFVYGLKDFGCPFLTMSIDLSTGEIYLIAETEDYISAYEMSVSRGNVYYLADEKTVYATDKVGQNKRRILGEEIFTEYEAGFDSIWAVGDWLYYNRMLEIYDDLQRWEGR